MESIGKLQCFRQDPSYRLLKENKCLSKKTLLNPIGFDQEVLECFPVLRLRGNAGKPWFFKRNCWEGWQVLPVQSAERFGSKFGWVWLSCLDSRRRIGESWRSFMGIFRLHVHAMFPHRNTTILQDNLLGCYHMNIPNISKCSFLETTSINVS